MRQDTLSSGSLKVLKRVIGEVGWKRWTVHTDLGYGQNEASGGIIEIRHPHLWES